MITKHYLYPPLLDITYMTSDEVIMIVLINTATERFKRKEMNKEEMQERISCARNKVKFEKVKIKEEESFEEPEKTKEEKLKELEELVENNEIFEDNLKIKE